MPKPKKGEHKKKFIKRCIPYLHENEPETLTSKDKKGKQSYAICNSLYDREKERRKNENIKTFGDFLKEGTSEPLDDEYDWEEEEGYEDSYNMFTGWLNEMGFDFFDGEQDFREKFEKLVNDDSIDKGEKVLKITEFLEDKWGLEDGWDGVYNKLMELL